jgi:hypothetical protein
VISTAPVCGTNLLLRAGGDGAEEGRHVLGARGQRAAVHAHADGRGRLAQRNVQPQRAGTVFTRLASTCAAASTTTTPIGLKPAWRAAAKRGVDQRAGEARVSGPWGSPAVGRKFYIQNAATQVFRYN